MGFQRFDIFLKILEQLKEMVKIINTYTNRKAIDNSRKK